MGSVLGLGLIPGLCLYGDHCNSEAKDREYLVENRVNFVERRGTSILYNNRGGCSR